MARTRKPSVNTRPVADQYAGHSEKIIELSSDGGGGLISLRVLNGRLQVMLYRLDPTVDVVYDEKASHDA